MLSLFRKYQKIVFLLVTVVIVTSFVFFGTYEVFTPKVQVKDEKLFQTIDGRTITQSYFSGLTRFLALEPLSLRSFGNILNDHVITKDFIESDIASIVIDQSREKILKDFEDRHVKEKSFRPYKHPIASDISAENVWVTFAPELKAELSKFTKIPDASSADGIKSRFYLFLMERKFPGELLSYILRYQEKENEGLEKDPRLNCESLALFGYKDLESWFGASFIESAANIIIKCAAFARVQGYKVSKDEVVAEILSKREKAYPYYKNHWNNSYAMYQDCLKLLQMDELMVFSIMEDILLFRHLFADVSEANFVDTFSLKKFYGKAHECIEAEISYLPSELILKNENELKKFQAYLDLSSSNGNELALPEALDSMEVAREKSNDLIATTYEVTLAHVSKRELEAKVSVKATWDWEEKNKELFSELKNYETVDKEKRAQIDSFARRKIVESHPEWIGSVLEAKTKEEKTLSLSPLSKIEKLAGIKDLQALSEELNKGEVSGYSQDKENFYSIKVKKSFNTLLSFKEALSEGVLDEISKKYDNEHFVKLEKDIFEDAKKEGFIDKGALFDDVKNQLHKWRFASHLRSENRDKSPWPLLKKREKIFRHGNGIVPFEQAIFADKKVFFSEVLGPFYYSQIERRVENPLPIEKMFMEEKLVSDEIKRHLLGKILGNSAA